MSKPEKCRIAETQDRTMDRKAVFDAGYNSYEDGDGELDFASGPSADDKSFAAMWRAGWQRAREDSALPRHGGAPCD